MRLLRRLFRDKFPSEDTSSEVFESGDKLVYRILASGFVKEVDLLNLQFAYINNDREGSFLELYDGIVYRIKISSSGFKGVYQSLSIRFSFDDEIFFDNVYNKTSGRILIWKKKQFERNYEILESNNLDYNLGFEIQSSEKLFFSWDSTFLELEQHPNTYFKTNVDGFVVWKFLFPVRVGNLLFKEFLLLPEGARKEVPMFDYRTKCYDSSGSFESFKEISLALRRDILNEKQPECSLTKKCHQLDVETGGIHFSLSYSNDLTDPHSHGFTRFHITNYRQYSSYEIDQEYEKNLVISDFVILKVGLHMQGSYRWNKNVKRRPSKITERFKDQTIIWRDDVNQKIGFSCGSMSQIYDMNNVQYLCLGNSLGSRDWNMSFLEIKELDAQDSMRLFQAELKTFDPYLERIKKLIGKDFGPEKNYQIY